MRKYVEPEKRIGSWVEFMHSLSSAKTRVDYETFDIKFSICVNRWDIRFYSAKWKGKRASDGLEEANFQMLTQNTENWNISGSETDVEIANTANLNSVNRGSIWNYYSGTHFTPFFPNLRYRKK